MAFSLIGTKKPNDTGIFPYFPRLTGKCQKQEQAPPPLSSLFHCSLFSTLVSSYALPGAELWGGGLLGVCCPYFCKAAENLAIARLPRPLFFFKILAE